MDDIHTPTVPAGPTSAQAEAQDFSKLSLTELIREKERLEAELQALIGILESVRDLCIRRYVSLSYLLTVSDCL